MAKSLMSGKPGEASRAPGKPRQESDFAGGSLMSRFVLGSLALLLVTGCAADASGSANQAVRQTESELPAQRVYQLFTYTANEGRLPDLERRFRDHTSRLFEKHGMVNVGYWIPQDSPLSANTLIYILSYPTREAGEAGWAALRADPEWQVAREASEQNGPLVASSVSVFLDPTDFSRLK